MTASPNGTPEPASVPAGPRRLSPLSVPYRTVERGSGPLLTLAFIGVSGASAVGEPLAAVAVAALVGLGVLAFVAYEVAYYRRFSYELTSDTLDVTSGVFARRNREIPLGRVQNVDVTRSAAQRILGIAAVNVETAGGSATEGVLRYVSAEEARRIQTGVAKRKRRLEADADVDADSAEEPPEPVDPSGETLFELTTAELFLSGALSLKLRLPILLVFLFSGSITAFLPTFSSGGATASALVGGALVAALLLIAWVGSILDAAVSYYGFTLRRVGDDLRYERGLLRRHDGTIPVEKIQTLTIRDNPLKRRFGYASLAVETAGYAPGSGGEQGDKSATVIPIAGRKRVDALARAIEPHGVPNFERPPSRIRRRYAVRYSLVVGGVTAVAYAVSRWVVSVPWYLPLAALPLAAVVGHYVWLHRGVWLDDDHLLTRNGFLRRETRIVPYDRIQTVIDSRTLFQRRWNVATVTADTAGSLSILGRDAAAVDVDGSRAEDLREELRDRSRRALEGQR